eukprot:c13937_g1_i1 orf=156-593(+)
MALQEQDEALSLPGNHVGAHDTLRYGIPAFKTEALPAHPAQVIQSTFCKHQDQTRRSVLEKVYGSALPLKMDIEEQILSRFQRPPGLLPSSMLGLESLTGALDEFGFGDFLNDPQQSESFVPVDMHHGMEIRLGLSKGPVARSFF